MSMHRTETHQALLEQPGLTVTSDRHCDAAPLDALRFDNLTPVTLDKPAFLMNCPFSYCTDQPNNAWMREMDERQRSVDRTKALSQFLQVYNHLAADSVVFLLPTPKDCKLQDLVFTANLGVALEHLTEENIVVLSNFTSRPRVGEARVGRSFFKAMGCEVVTAPHKFEGEAELKHLYDNVYIGGYGIRSDRRTYEWMEAEFDMKVIKVEEVDEYLYHLDCSIFPITDEDTLVCTEMFTKRELKQIEKHTNVIDVTADSAYSGICNSVRLHNSVLNASHLHSLKAGSDDYMHEIRKNRELEDIAIKLGLEVNYFNLSEYMKGGALQSCMVMHLNRRSYAFRLI
jgi:N-dimethylarginine dimethylaminohydrolase